MIADRFEAITSRYASLRVAVLGDFCLDRYLEIDPDKQEVSLETGLPVYNVIKVRPQPGGAGTILNNLSALGIGTLYPLGLAGEDGEGFELCRALEALAGVRMGWFLRTAQRRTFTYCKPLLVKADAPPVELNRLDFKDWTPTPAPLEERLIEKLEQVAPLVDALIVLDQARLPECGVITRKVLGALRAIAQARPSLLILADGRRGLREFPPVVFKMNAAELAALKASETEPGPGQIEETARALACRNGHPVFVTLAARGILAASPDGQVHCLPALPLRGRIDIVGAGDAVSANLTAALAAGANMLEALELANAAASIVIHQLGTTGTASLREMRDLLFGGFSAKPR